MLTALRIPKHERFIAVAIKGVLEDADDDTKTQRVGLGNISDSEDEDDPI